MNLGLMHLRRNMRSPKVRKEFNYLMYVVGLSQPLALLPQVLSIYQKHQTAGVSLTTWALLLFFNTMWMLYGIVHRDKLIAAANTLLILLDLAIVFGVLYY